MARIAATTTTTAAAKTLGCTVRWVCYLIQNKVLEARRDERGFWQVRVSSVIEEQRARTVRAKLRSRKDARIDADAKRGGARGAHRAKR